MSDYVILITRTAQKQLDKLPDNVVESLLIAIQNLAQDPRLVGSKKMKGRDGYRVRKGEYRIIYDVLDDELIVEVIALGHRKDIYQ